jgi:hypothetical protein
MLRPSLCELWPGRHRGRAQGPERSRGRAAPSTRNAISRVGWPDFRRRRGYGATGPPGRMPADREVRPPRCRVIPTWRAPAPAGPFLIWSPGWRARLQSGQGAAEQPFDGLRVPSGAEGELRPPRYRVLPIWRAPASAGPNAGGPALLTNRAPSKRLAQVKTWHESASVAASKRLLRRLLPRQLKVLTRLSIIGIGPHRLLVVDDRLPWTPCLQQRIPQIEVRSGQSRIAS